MVNASAPPTLTAVSVTYLTYGRNTLERVREEK